MIDKIEDTLWTVQHSFTTLGIPITSRMTLAKVNQSEWAAISVVPLTPDQIAEINRAGKVSYIIAPNNFHHLFVNDAKAYWPNAAIYIPPTLSKKRPDLAAAQRLGANELPWSKALKHVAIAGSSAIEEFAFFHVPSKSLILTDLCFNMKHPQGFRQTLFTLLTGTKGELKTSRMIKLLFKNKTALKNSLQQVLEWPFERLIVAHGEIVEESTKTKLQQSFAWLLD